MSDNFRETKLSVELGGEQVEFISLIAQETISTPYEIELEIAAPLGAVSYTHLTLPTIYSV